MSVGLNSGAASWTEAPRRCELNAAFLAVVGHGIALPVDENDSTAENRENMSAVTGGDGVLSRL